MLLMTIVYNDDIKDITSDLQYMKQCFASKNIIIGISERILNNNHVINIVCEDEYYTEKIVSMLYQNLANILYRVVLQEFCENEIIYLLNEIYFFLKPDELEDIREICIGNMDYNSNSSSKDFIFSINRQNSIIDKIVSCIEQNKEININGFVTFRMKELKIELEAVVDKVVENYMAEKEYNEFIKLLKYFVEIQDSKIDSVNILINQDGKYIILDRLGNDIFENLVNDIYDISRADCVSLEDVIISGLIATSPRKISIHCSENSSNIEFIDTIKNVFGERCTICNECKLCKNIKKSLTLK